MKYLDPKNDLTFKKIFGQHPHLLRSFLNAMLPLAEGSHITELDYLPADLVPETPLLKYSSVDVRCKDNTGRQFIVEMQMHWTTSFMQRVLFNASKAYVKQLEKAYEYNLLQPVYALSLVNENFLPGKNEFYHHYQIVNIQDTEQQIEGLEFVFIELQKFKAINFTEKKLQVLWLRFMTEIDENITEVPEDFQEIKEIMEAVENLKTSAFTSGELESYEKYWDAVRSEKTLRKEDFNKGKAEGRAEGKAEGKAEGRAEGKIEVARRAKQKGMPVKDISELTGLTAEEIEGL